MQFPLNCTGKIVWAKIPYFGGASQFRRGWAGFATFAAPGGDEIAHLQRLKITRQASRSDWRKWCQDCSLSFRFQQLLLLHRIQECSHFNIDRFCFLDIATSIDVLCVIEDEDNWLSGRNLTHERIPAGFLGSLESCTSFRCLTSLDYAHCAPCREKLDTRVALENWNDRNSFAVQSDSQCQILFRTMPELLLQARAGLQSQERTIQSAFCGSLECLQVRGLTHEKLAGGGGSHKLEQYLIIHCVR